MTTCPPRFDELCVVIHQDYDVTNTLEVKSDGSVFDLTGYTAKQGFFNQDGTLVATATMTIDTGLGTVRSQLTPAQTGDALVIAEAGNYLKTDIYLSNPDSAKPNFYLYEGQIPVVAGVTQP